MNRQKQTELAQKQLNQPKTNDLPKNILNRPKQHHTGWNWMKHKPAETTIEQTETPWN